jgi:hypothetical protein
MVFVRDQEVGRCKRKADLKFKALKAEEKSMDYNAVRNKVHSRTKKIREYYREAHTKRFQQDCCVYKYTK